MSTRSSNAIVTLDFYQQKFKKQVEEDYYLTEDQAFFTSLPKDAIKSYDTAEDRYPIVILNGTQPAGFFILHGWEGVKSFYSNKRAILIRAFSIQADYQGQGIAHECFRRLPSFIKKHFPDKNEIVLAVNHKNTIAQHVYKKGGFTDKGIRAMGKRGRSYIMHLSI
ncbi:ribosomal protein S18 acetylase RimI-like enzyme [Peribacillus deserti]|uniref:Ribosomal protein S18 acetylase RimI-like enzyme n=1 Tax=Peribacillus deserti TaxID=673318 RepID=A0ABS2QDA9_9BACI|nr:GNAT family N-acetyltransferase [Peribacillus deserti]MBM7691077.1 ribosomal protein S18 acetylase RimI-like enzyme [Peribacillus deserti]